MPPGTTVEVGQGVLLKVRTAHCTVMVAGGVGEGPPPGALLAVTDALLVTGPQVVAVETTWIVTLPVLADRVAKVHVSTWGVASEWVVGAIEQPAGVPAGLSDHVPALLGRLSVTTTFMAVPGPVFVTMMVKPIGAPRDTVDGRSADFVMWRAGHCTVVVARGDEVTLSGLLLDDVTVALLEMAVQSAAVVCETTWMVTDVWAPSVPWLHVRTPPEMVQLAAVVGAVVVQLRPALFGRVSVMTTPLAVPLPELVTVIRYPIWLPALTL
jgi:hypothetical protein